MRKHYFLFVLIWAALLMWPSRHGESKVATVKNAPSLESRMNALYTELDANIDIATKQQDSLKLMK